MSVNGRVEYLSGIQPRLRKEEAAYKKACIRMGMKAGVEMVMEAIKANKLGCQTHDEFAASQAIEDILKDLQDR